MEMEMICALIAESMCDTGKPQKVKRKKIMILAEKRQNTTMKMQNVFNIVVFFHCQYKVLQ